MKRHSQFGLWFAALAAASLSATAAQPGDFNNVERASRVLGKEVTASGGDRVGEIDNLVVDLESGRVLYAVVDTGKDKVALPPGIFSDTRGEEARINASEDKLDNAPRFTRETGSASDIDKASFVSRVHRHFGQNEWWAGSRPSDQGSFNNVHRLTDLRGVRVVNVQDQNMGKISNLAIDLPAGRVVYVLLSPDESLGVSEGLYALPPNLLTQNKKYDTTTFSADITKDKLADGPRLANNDWSKLSSQPWASSVYSHYGKQAYFSSGALTPTGRDSDSRVGSSTPRDDDQVISREPTTRERQRASERERQRSGWNRGRIQDRPRDTRTERDTVISRPGTTRSTDSTPNFSDIGQQMKCAAAKLPSWRQLSSVFRAGFALATPAYSVLVI